jgi:hypothetical protein
LVVVGWLPVDPRGPLSAHDGALNAPVDGPGMLVTGVQLTSIDGAKYAPQ